MSGAANQNINKTDVGVDFVAYLTLFPNSPTSF